MRNAVTCIYDDEQTDTGADHSRGDSIQDVSIRRSSLVVQNLRNRDLYRATIGGNWGQGDIR